MSRQKRPSQTVANDAEPSRRTLARMARVERTVAVKSLDATQVLEAADTAEHLAEALREQAEQMYSDLEAVRLQAQRDALTSLAEMDRYLHTLVAGFTSTPRAR